MTSLTHVLCPIDFSEFSAHALDYAAAIAGWYEATLTVLYVIPNLTVMDLPAIVPDASEQVRIREEMRRFTAHLPPGTSLDLRVQDASDVHREILAQAQALPADMLVVGSHGRSGFERLLLGSVTEKVIRKAPCPTMIVPRRAPDVPPDRPIRLRSIVAPVDVADAAQPALAYATSLAEETDATLTVLHVISVPPVAHDLEWPSEIDVTRIRKAVEAGARQRLAALISPEVRTFCTVDTVVREGAPYREILAAAGERQADLIVMGVHGRRAIDRLVFGSNTARVMREASCPVLLVPAA